jgi:Phage integrase family
MYKRTPLEKRLRLRGGIWSFWGYDYRGKRYTASTHQSDYKAALKAARKREGELAVPPADPAAEKAKDFTLAQALGLIEAHDKRVRAAPNTITFHRDRGRHLVRLLGAKRLCSSIDLEVLQKYTDDRLAEEPDPHTIQKEHRVLRQALGMAKKLGYYLGEPSSLVIEGFVVATGMNGYYQVGEEWLEKVEWIEALVAHTSSNPDRHRVDRRDDILVYVNLGPRRREVLLIKPEHVDLQKRQLEIRMPKRQRVEKRTPRKTGLKTDKSKRILPLNDLMVELFRRRLKHTAPGQALFTDWGSGNRDLQANWRRARAWLLKRAEEKGGKRARAELDEVLPTGLTFNGLRRTFCSQMKNAGVSLDDCAELLGHEDLAMVKLVYGHTAMDTLRTAVSKLPEMTLPPQPIPTRTQKVSRRHRQRLRAQARAEAAAGGAQACPSSEATDTVSDTNPMRNSTSEGAG